MADFGPQATELSAPQGAGANVVAPTTANPLGAIVEGIGNVTDAFVKVKTALDKNDAKSKAEAKIAEYTKKKGDLDQAIAGGMPAAKALVHSQNLFREYAVANPALREEFEKVNKGFSNEGSSGVAEEAVKTDLQIQREKVKFAQSKGFYIPPNMPPEALEVVLKHVSNVELRDQETQRNIRDAVEARTSANFDREAVERKLKENTLQMLASTNETYLDASVVQITQLVNNAKNGVEGETPDSARLKLSQYFNKNKNVLLAISQSNPELASSFTATLNNMEQIGLEMLKPGAESKELEERLKVITLKGKLNALDDPEVYAAYNANQLFVNNPGVMEKTVNAALRSYTISLLPGRKSNNIGSKDEKQVLDLATDGLNNFNTGMVGDKAIAKTQATNSVNSIVSEVGSLNYFTEKRTPDQMKQSMSFLASDQFGKFVSKEGGLNPEKAAEAERAFRQGYASPLLRSLNERLLSPIPEPYATDIKSLGAKNLIDLVSVKFDGNSIKFIPNEKVAGNNAIVNGAITPSLRNAENVVNQLLKIGSHLNATQDYKGQFEQYKYELLPQFFPARPGTVVNGMIYNGKGEPGDFKDKNNWKPVKKPNE